MLYRQIGLEEFCLEGGRRHDSEIARLTAMRDRYDFNRESIESALQEMRGALDEFLT